MGAKIKDKPCLSARCKNRHKSEGDYCVEHAHLGDRHVGMPKRRACSDPHLIEEHELGGLGIEWSLKRNVL